MFGCANIRNLILFVGVLGLEIFFDLKMFIFKKAIFNKKKTPLDSNPLDIKNDLH